MNWILFSFILFCVGAFGVAWRSWARPAGRLRTRASGYVSDHSARLANSAVHRLFSAADEQFAARFGKQIARRLRRNRRYAMNLYLGQLRREFQSAARVARDAAAHSDTPADAMKILR